MLTARSRPLTDAFLLQMERVFRMANPAGGDGVFNLGRYTIERRKDGAYYGIAEQSDLLMGVDSGRQYGSLQELKNIEREFVSTKAPDIYSRRAKDIGTRMASLLSDIYRDYPDAGFAVSTNKLMILKDQSKVETPDNVLIDIALSGVVRSEM